MMRNRFVREEEERLVLASGLPANWLAGRAPLRLGPTPTPHGPITVEVRPRDEEVEVSWQAKWRGKPPVLEVALRGCPPVTTDGASGAAVVVRRPGGPP
jgi:hypothetical protein